MIEKMKTWIAENANQWTLFLQELVRKPSLPGKEAPAQNLIEEKLKALGAVVERWEPGGEALLNHPHFCSSRRDFRGSPNVAGVWKGKGGGRSLLLNGHIDVVPVGDPQQWVGDPFSGKIEAGKLYGRGVTDMKGGLVSMLLAMECLQAFQVQLKGDVIFQSVVEEESGGAGTLSALLKGYRADGAIIPEPTDMRIFPKQQGSMWFRITVKGRAAHGGSRYDGVSAIEKSALVVEAIRSLEQKRNEGIKDPLYDKVPIPIPINIGTIHGGEWPSSVPDQVEITGRMGVAPEEEMFHAQQALENTVQSIDDPWLQEHPPLLEWFGGRWLPGTLSTPHPLLDTLTTSYMGAMGIAPEIEASPWGTDGGLLNKIGGIPVLIFGPGKTSMAHYPNEFIEIDKVGQCAVILADAIMDWCKVVK